MFVRRNWGGEGTEQGRDGPGTEWDEYDKTLPTNDKTEGKGIIPKEHPYYGGTSAPVIAYGKCFEFKITVSDLCYK